MSLYPIAIFVKKKTYKDYKKLINHESIHWQQQKEMLGLFFYLWYFIEWFINIFIYGKRAYVKLSHEQEAYDNDQNLNYLVKRKRYSWVKYIKYKPVK
jgi:hypothetical protein